jgi:hypothetical protein
MSALGHKRTFEHLSPMSALPPKAALQPSEQYIRLLLLAHVVDECLSPPNLATLCQSSFVQHRPSGERHARHGLKPKGRRRELAAAICFGLSCVSTFFTAWMPPLVIRISACFRPSADASRSVQGGIL